jgi:hypothetical protein
MLYMWKRHFTFFYKYICCWLMAEGACDITGVAYMGRNKDGSPHWYSTQIGISRLGFPVVTCGGYYGP